MSTWNNFLLRLSRFRQITPESLGKIIADEKSNILTVFLDRVRAEIPAAKGEKDTYLADHIPDFIDELIEFLVEKERKSNFQDFEKFAAVHGLFRAQSGKYSVQNLRHEYSILRETIISKLPPFSALSNEGLSLFSKAFDISLSRSVEIFLRNSLLDMRTASESVQNSENQQLWIREALNRLPKPLFLLDMDGKKISYTNAAARRMLGIDYTGQNAFQVVGKTIIAKRINGELIKAEDMPSSRLLRGETVNDEEILLTTSTGEYHIKVFSEHLPSMHGQPASVLILFQDITTLKKTEGKLRSTQSELKKAVEIAQVGFWNLDPQTQKISVTLQFLEQFGIEKDSFKSTLDEAVKVMHPDDRDRVTSAINNSIQTQTPCHIQYRVVHSNDEVRWIEAKGEGVYAPDGQPIRFTGTTIDVTTSTLARIIAEESVRELQILADSMPQIVWSAKANGDLNYFNQVWFDYSGSILEQNIGIGWTQFVHPEDLPETGERWKNSLKTNTLYENQFRLRRHDGQYRWFVARAVPAFDTLGKLNKWYGTNTDIHDQKILNDQLQDAREVADRANAAKSQFLANMSHEIRTPLGAIMGFASLLKDDGLGSEERDSFSSVIERNSFQLLRIIDDILDLSKVEAGMMLIEHIEFSLPEMLTDFSSLMGFKAREKGIGFASKAMTSLPSLVTTDPTRLRQILINVVGNAIKFTERGHVEMRICYKDGFVDFEVEDTGRGISPEQEQNLFQPFTQADTSTTRKFGGTGLGLVLSRTLAEALGGTFELKRSVLGQGSTFMVRIAVAVKSDVKYVNGLGFETVPVRSVAHVGQLSGLKVLLVEDSPDNQALISIYLGRVGANIDIASDGEQGYAMAIENRYDLVLMDVQMPIMDGITTIKKLRAAGYNRTVIALTAHAMKEERKRCLDAGFTDFLSKPIPKDELINMLVRYKSKLR
ncbi:MAG: hypothetical protein B7Y39_03755 [Bdellovibrio sp. 28-41-41]|nr:MAG: hypothetical protein B7Y39_03755 [Bdellovibrio sp. 28-41-41]